MYSRPADPPLFYSCSNFQICVIWETVADLHSVFADQYRGTILAHSHLFFQAYGPHWQQPFLLLLDKLIRLGKR